MTPDAQLTTVTDVRFSFSHVALLVADLRASVCWYRDLLDWTEEFVSPMASELGDLNGFTGKAGTVAMGTVDGVRVELVQMDTDQALAPASARDRHGLFLMAIRVDDLAAVRRRCGQLGTRIIREGTIGQTTTLIVEDPDGQEIAVLGVEP
jgi:catechol 2,3-dioxygenase-like lactoylglutathione lyase family enzyme